MLTALQPKPFRGDQVAAGVVVLTVFVTLVSIRFAGDWSDAALVVFSLAAALFVATLAVQAPQEGETPRAYQTILYVSTYVLGLTAIVVFSLTVGDGDGDGPPAARTVALVAAIMAAVAAFFALQRGSPTSTLLAATSVGVAFVATVVWVADAELQAVRWMLAILIVLYALATVSVRDRHPGHAAQIANAGGVAALAIAAPDLFFFVFGVGFEGEGGDGGYPYGTGWGWELVVLAAGFGLVSYGAVDHEQGPAALGVADLAAFVLLAAFVGDDPGFVGWPLALAIVAVIMLAVGLRPTTPAPPEPDLHGHGHAREAIELPPREPPTL